jgi:hypothetical protein
MAYYEYTCGGRALANPTTFARIQMYLREIDRFLEAR